MALEVNRDIKVDFYDKNYILINAKQYDKNSRFITVICHSQGKPISINSKDHSAFVRYQKADDCSVFNSCDIVGIGKIKIKLTEQMLASAGVCYVDLVIVNKGEAEIDPNTGELKISGAEVLSTSTFCVDVSETATENSEIECSPEYGGLSELLTKAEADYQKVVLTSRSWAEGGTGIRDGEDTNNSKYWSEQSEKSASAASNSADNAATSEFNANEYMSNALEYKGAAEQSATAAKQSEDNAFDSKNDASISEHNAKVWATGGYLQAREGETVDTNEIVGTEENARQASESATTAQRYAVGGTGTVDDEDEDNAKWYWQQSTILADSANKSATAAETSADRAQSYAVGGTGTRDGEDTNNAQWYYNEIKDILNGLNIVFVPKGTIYFSELATVKESAVPGYIYNIKDDFVTDDSFREGSDVTYTAGTNVYYIIDENGEYKWDCFGGAASPVAAVEDVKDYLGINEEIVIG